LFSFDPTDEQLSEYKLDATQGLDQRVPRKYWMFYETIEDLYV
jgi:hypothetical protein